jgi:hypothetical protein
MEEKVALVVHNMGFLRGFAAPFVRQQLGQEAAAELETIWQQGLGTFPIDAPAQERYEAAYSNWIGMARSTYAFLGKRLGEEGMRALERAEVDALKREIGGAAMILLRLVRGVAPGLAFTTAIKQMGYQLQWLTPCTLTELTAEKAVFDIPQCRILSYPSTEEICEIGCHRIYPTWVAEQFSAEMRFEIQGRDCTLTVTPMA